MDALETLGLMAELHNSHCGLNHGPNTTNEKLQAVDWLVIPLGDIKSNIVMDKLTIPICKECSDGLSDESWALHYCVECNASQWVLKKLSKIKYEKNLILCVGCLNCSKKAKKIFPI